ncbi:KAP family P-loop NTPase fold protein [Lactobacillus johnsonii]|uniref:KAP family NTPase n=1 Tax=Lactobacillus johnsonii TaxID=33959 RepID=A0AAW5M0V4_LACJH|nr:KAP family NTPase [Lactobacillus johnsonii]MCR1913995.1 KAP family NTPase [Lactobacillus johnsonii]
MGKEKSIFRELFTELQQTNIMYVSLISIYLLIIIDYLNPTGRVTAELWVSTVVIGILISFWFVINNKILLLFKINSINALDDINLYIVISDLGYGLYLLITKQYFSWKFVGVLLLALLSLSIGIYRIICLQQAILKRLKNDEECHLVELKDLYKNNLNVSLPIFIKDRAVKDDLLGRDSIITLLYKSICQNFSKQDSFVIGLSGPWGSGKTTVTNIVRKQLAVQNSDIKIIKGLNPWISGSEAVLLNSFYDALLNALGINYSSRKIRKQVREVSRYVVEIPTVGKSLSKVLEKDINQENIEKWQANLKNLILSSDKKYVLFIDDLDRATSAQIRFLLKMLGSLFNLPNVIFVLLYDRSRLEKILQDDNKLNTSFAEKVINLELQVPKVSENSVQKIYRSCLINLARIYNVSDKEVNNLDSAFQLIIKSIDNPREFIRFLNSTCYIAFSPDINLNRNDLLLIEYISFKQPDLFQLIKENPKLFVSENSGLDISDVFNPKQLISKIYDLYSNVLKDKYSSWLPILEVLFPFVKQCQIGNGHLRVNNNSNEGRMNNRIYDGYNFDLYFSLRKDFVVGKNKKLKVIVDKLKEKTNRKQIENLEKEIFEDSKAKVSESIHLFSMYENEFNSKTGLALCKVILDNMEKVPEDVEAVGLSPRNIAASICISLLRDTPKEKISKLLEKYHNNYELIDVFDDLHTFSKDIKKIHKVAYSIWRRMCIDAIKDSINLYNDKYYKPRLIRKLYRGIEGDKKEIIATYLKAIAKKDNIYRIFYDFISVSGNDNGIGYIFKQKDYELLESAQLKNSLPIPMNISQKVIYDIYSKGSRKGYDYRYKDIEINIEEL